ncbi:MAG: hypothetical protein NTW30_05005 [Candidatus Aenigmarchaeota archaeon]|nr:hypothetical protein [Candidatus Aenigmarchaeota archaeon]
MENTVSIPSFIQGELNESGNNIYEEFKDEEVKLKLKLFEPTSENLRQIVSNLRNEIQNSHNRTTKEIIEILGNVGERWKKSDQYKQCLELLPTIYNRPRLTVEGDLKTFEYFLRSDTLNLLINHEFEAYNILDKWIFDKGIWKRRQPHGLVFHNLAGNSPMVALSEIVGVLTKNVNLVKTASDDPLTPEKIAEVIFEEDKTLGRRLSVVYWKGEVDKKPNELYSVLFPTDFQESPIDAVTFWGSMYSVTTGKRIAAKAGIPVIEHGPKYSFDVIIEDQNLPENLYMEIVGRDIIPHEQEACNSSRVVFVKPLEKNGGIKIAKGLTDAFEKNQEMNPKKNEEFEYKKTMSLRFSYFPDKLEGKADVLVPRGGKVYWTVVYLNQERKLQRADLDACMRRFIIVKEVGNEDEIIDFIKENNLKKYIQRVGIYGTEHARTRLADQLTLYGADSITYTGMLSIKMPGETHDGFYNLPKFTRLCTMVER